MRAELRYRMMKLTPLQPYLQPPSKRHFLQRSSTFPVCPYHHLRRPQKLLCTNRLVLPLLLHFSGLSQQPLDNMFARFEGALMSFPARLGDSTVDAPNAIDTSLHPPSRD